MTKAFISGCAGPELSAGERAFFTRNDPWGLILFRRNCENREQVSALVESFRSSVGRSNAPVFIDQEGGRVQRLRPPHWPDFPAQKLYGDLFCCDPARGREAAFLGARLIAHELRSIGITVNCLPLLDVAGEDMVGAIGDRAYSDDPGCVAMLGRETCEGLLEGGVLPVIKHLPGHGRARVDSHHELPCITACRDDLEMTDFVPFKALAGYPLAMTAHLLFPELDPEAPATQSRHIIETVIRQHIGFEGCLISDDINMQALSGEIQERASAGFAAGCDIILHCSGDFAEMEAVAGVSPEVSGLTAERCDKALMALREPDPAFDSQAAWSRFRTLIAGWS